MGYNGTKVRSPRAGVRRQILRKLRTVASILRSEVGVWAADSVTYDRAERGLRYKTLAEYPENDAEQMRRSSQLLMNLSAALVDVATRLRNEAAELDERRAGDTS